jgi:hypothetical protein
MKITIVKKINPLSDTHFFNIKVDDSHVKSCAFKFNEPEESIYNETKAYNEAMTIVQRIELAGTFKENETTVFEKEIPPVQ